MATRIQLDFPKLGLGDYDRVCEALNFPADWPEGLLAHGSAQIDGHLRVVDVWNSAADFDRFLEQRLGSAISETLGERAEQPERSDTELHSFHTRST